MAGILTTIWWRDIPAQVIARDGRLSHKIVLHPRFQVAIDRAAMAADRRTYGEYIEDWGRDGRPCSDDLEGQAIAEAHRLEAIYTKELLAAIAKAGGIDPDRRARLGADPHAEPDDAGGQSA